MPFRLQSRACVAALAVVVFAHGQGTNPKLISSEQAMRAQANPHSVKSWLESKDPRLIAWGAYFARENDEQPGLTIAAHLLQQSLESDGPGLFSSGRPQQNALSEVLDALIQRRVLLSAEMIGYVSLSHPVQAIILLSMLPAGEQTDNLIQWHSGARSPAGSNHLDRVSGMLLSKRPPPGFAATTLRNSEERLAIYIVPKAFEGIGAGGGSCSCGDGAVDRPPDGWPDISSYHLLENEQAGLDPLLVEAGGDRIYWQRSMPGGGFRLCGGVAGLTSETRHHLLAEMLKVNDQAMSWPTQKTVSIVKVSDRQVERDIGAAIQKEQAILLKSVEEFGIRNLITGEEAGTVMPKLSIVIHEEPSSALRVHQ